MINPRAALLLLFGVSVAAVAGGTMGPVAMNKPTAAQPSSLAPVAAQSGLQASPAYPSPIASDVARWNSLRQSSRLPFSSYSSFLLSHRGWPEETALRRMAEQRDDASPSEAIRFFTAFPPLTAAGHARYALALHAMGRIDEARREAREAWTGGVLPDADEPRLIGAFGSTFTPQDHDRRMAALLDARSAEGRRAAQRGLAWASPARRQVYGARLALQSGTSDAAAQFAALGPAAARADVGLAVDRALWLRDNRDSAGARQLLAERRTGGVLPGNPEKVMEAMVVLARAAAADRQWTLAYQIASQVDDLFPAGTDVSRRSYGERDEYTNLTWLAGQSALRLARPADAARMFEKYGRAAQSQQTRAKGFYWAGRAAAQAGQAQQSTAMLELAASPDQFYGQLALERLGRAPTVPAADPPITAAERSAFAARPVAQALRHLGMIGDRADQTLFVRAIAEQLENDRERAIAADFGRQIGRLDMGVWAAREARSKGANFYARSAFPSIQIPPAHRQHWALAHGIIRQESSFERSAVSHAGARGLMQLMPGTAAQEARSLGVTYAASRLTEDPSYNVLLGTQHLSRLMDNWGGNAVLVAAAYNAGSGNARRWVNEFGDPRVPGTDVVAWIEQIPFSETRNYVQRVIENAVVYDMLDPSRTGQPRNRISYYLGQRQPG